MIVLMCLSVLGNSSSVFGIGYADYVKILTEGDKYRLARSFEEHLRNHAGNCYLTFEFFKGGQSRYKFQQTMWSEQRFGMGVAINRIDQHDFIFEDLELGDYDLKVSVYTDGVHRVREYWVIFQDEQKISLANSGNHKINVFLKIPDKIKIPFYLQLPENFVPPDNGKIKVHLVNPKLFRREGSDTELITTEIQTVEVEYFSGSIFFWLDYDITGLPTYVYLYDKDGNRWETYLEPNEEKLEIFLLGSFMMQVQNFVKVGQVSLNINYEHHRQIANGLDDYVDAENPAVLEIDFQAYTNYIITTDRPLDDRLNPTTWLRILVLNEENNLVEQSSANEISQSLFLYKPIIGSREKIFKIVILGPEEGGFFSIRVQNCRY